MAWLRTLWQRAATIPGLPLVEADETALGYALALRGVDGQQALLDAQRDRITNPDRKARFEFVREAVSADAGERERGFRGLADPANRSREHWVAQGLGLLNHPLRGDQSARWLPEALEMLLEVHRTGALLFDAYWLDATLGWHSSPQVAAAVTRFIDTLPADYPPKLRDKVLQISDMLMRAARSAGAESCSAALARGTHKAVMREEPLLAGSVSSRALRTPDLGRPGPRIESQLPGATSYSHFGQRETFAQLAESRRWAIGLA